MRYVFAILALLMFLFAVVQYNDPDGPLWMLFYGVPAFWAGVAALRPPVLAGSGARALLVLSTVAIVALTTIFWPAVEAWWLMDIWWESEEAREGMGLMLASLVLLAVLAASFARQPRTARPT